ncbi:uncharacterized protein V6R79_017205 [Siganus canaliculatus]
MKVDITDVTAVTNERNTSQLDGFSAQPDNDDSHCGKEKEEKPLEACNISLSETCTDDAPASEEDNEFSAVVSQEQLLADEDTECHLETNKEGREVCVTDAKEVENDTAAVALPAKKKRRMGMCGLTEKERTHFLQAQKRENGQIVLEKAEEGNSDDFVAQEKIISTEQNKMDTHCGGGDRADSEVPMAGTILDNTSNQCDPRGSNEGSCEAERGSTLSPEQTADTRSDPSAEEELLGIQEQRELEGSPAENAAEKPQEEEKNNRRDCSVSAEQSFHSSPTVTEEAEDLPEVQAANLQSTNVTGFTDEQKEELVCSTGDLESVELCEAAATPGVSEGKDRCDTEDDPPGPATLNTEPLQTWNSADPFGSGLLDYVSDSQLNTIPLIAEQQMEQGDLSSLDCGDATDLICGLIRELSSLNRKVMATHRELENLRRSTKTSRSSTR